MARNLYGTVIVTYRCNAHCNMCDCFKHPTKPEEEITLDVIRKLYQYNRRGALYPQGSPGYRQGAV